MPEIDPTVPGEQPPIIKNPPCPICSGEDTEIGDEGINAQCNECGYEWTYSPIQAMSVVLNKKALDKVHSEIDKGNWVDDDSWSAPNSPKSDESLGIHTENKPGSKGRQGYPCFKGGKVSRKGLIAVEQRARGQGAGAIADAAKSALAKIDAKRTKKMSLIVDLMPDGVSYMSLVGGGTEDVAPPDLFDSTGKALPVAILGLPCTYCWKDLSSVGDWRNTSRNFDFPVTDNRIDHWVNTYNAMSNNGVRVPIVDDHSEAAKDSNGWIVKMRRKGDRLQGLMQLVGDEARRKAASNDVSVGADPKMVDASKNEYKDAIRHVALTPLPMNPGLHNAILAASRSVAGQEATNTPTDTSQKGKKDMSDTMLKCSEACMSGLHSLIPGLAEAPDEEKMSRIHQHMLTKADEDKKDAGGDTATMSQAQISAKAKDRRKAAFEAMSQVQAKDAQIVDLNGKIQEMSKNVVGPLDDDTYSVVMDAVNTKKGLVASGHGITEACVNSLVMTMTGTKEKPNWLGMSRKANPLGNSALVFAVLDVLATNSPPPATGQEVGTQTMSRNVPGADTPATLSPADKFRKFTAPDEATIL